MSRKWITLGLAFATGVSFGVAGSWTWLEDRANRKYQAWVATRVATEDHVKDIRAKREADPKPFDLPTIKAELKVDKTTLATLVEPYLPRGDFAIITEEEFDNRGDNDLDKITIERFETRAILEDEDFRDDLQYQLVMDGETVLDWKDILTPDVIESLKGKDGIHLRNDRKGEVYYVTWGQP